MAATASAVDVAATASAGAILSTPVQRDIADTFRRAMEAYNRGHYELALADFHPQLEWEVNASLVADAATYSGNEGVRRFWGMWREAIEGMSLEVEECRTVAPDLVLAITRAQGTGAGSGAQVASGRFAQVARYSDGRVVKVHLYRNVSEALRALGERE